MLRLGIDIDGTINHTQEAAIQVYNRHFQRDFTLEDVPDYLIGKAYGVKDEDGPAVWQQLEADIYAVGKPFPHAAEVLQQLSQEGHQIYYITARPDYEPIVEITKNWLQEFGFPYVEEQLYMNSTDKVSRVHKLGIDLFFEDTVYHLERLYQAQILTVIMDAPYNRNLPADMLRITDWRQVPAIVQQIEQEKNRV
jgi:uncharacterized HAD superfamily protein